MRKSVRLPRVIPVLLLKGQGLTKSVKFRDYTYIGDAINACRIYNEMGVDELFFVDINATKENRGPRMQFLHDIATECFMPLGYAGGITSLQQFDDLFKAGIEKVAVNTSLYGQPELITEAAKAFGSQSVLAVLDVRKPLLGGYKLHSASGSRAEKPKPVDFAKEMEDRGAGEIVVQSIDRDGTMEGYDLTLVREIASAVSIPVVALGGAGNIGHMVDAVQAGASAVAAGSVFVFHGRHRAVLINYPSRQERITAFTGSA